MGSLKRDGYKSRNHKFWGRVGVNGCDIFNAAYVITLLSILSPSSPLNRHLCTMYSQLNSEQLLIRPVYFHWNPPTYSIYQFIVPDESNSDILAIYQSAHINIPPFQRTQKSRLWIDFDPYSIP